MNAALASIRDVGLHHLRRARELAAPRRPGPPRNGETRPAPVHDRAFERRRALRLARYYFTAAARLVNVRRGSAAAGRRETEGIPLAVGSVMENRHAGVEPAAAPVDSLPTDAAQRRCVAGPVTVSSDTARAGVSS